MKREFLGQPLWLWAAGAAVVIGGYLYFRHKASSGSPQQGQGSAATGTATGGGSYHLKEWITQHQGAPGPKPAPVPDGPGPEREWLIRKTGSKRPWTFLSQHHEKIVVGPDGSRKIVKA